MRLTRRPFADLVFHVLAHVPGRFAASVYDRGYVGWTESHLGPLRGRDLGEGVDALARMLTSHEACVRVQWLAWLFGDLDRAARAYDRPLSELTDGDVDRSRVLARLRADPRSETLYCTVALEAEWHARLPPWGLDPGLEAALAARRIVAPELARFDVGVVRSLARRGRVFEGEIWVGASGEVPPWASCERVAWQAAHEATVAELSGARLAFEELEHAAVVLLRERAARVGEGAAHARWLETLDAPSPRRASLAQEARAAVDAALDRSST